MTGRLGIADVSPVVSCGRYPARAVVGERLPIAATVFREGHDAVAATVAWRSPAGETAALVRMTPGNPGLDRWHATVTPTEPGAWTFAVEAWGDPVAAWRHRVEVKIDAGQGVEDLANDLEDGARLLTRALRTVPPEAAGRLTAAIEALRDERRDLFHRVGPALSDELGRLLAEHPVRELLTRSPRYTVWVDRQRALFGSWYELFPRSEGAETDQFGRPLRHGTFKDAARRLPQLAEQGFDIVYLPPIHPIGRINRKGRNNTLMPEPEDVGSPWAIGSEEGGHDAIHPQLGTVEDFDDFVARTRELGMEVALDLALQTAPDHPWVTEHPEWFTTRPDGSIAYAENPPKKYQDIYPMNFDNDPKGIYAEVLRIVRLLGRARGPGLPGGQPAHEAAELLALADLGGQEDRPGRALPRRGVHPAGDDAHPRPGRLHPVVHVLHLADREVGAGGVRPGAGRPRPTTCGRTSSSTRPTSCTRACRPAGRRCSRSGPCWPR